MSFLESVYDDVRPRTAVYPRVQIAVTRPPGCRTWRVSVLIHNEVGPPLALESSAGTGLDGWNQALHFVEQYADFARGAP